MATTTTDQTASAGLPARRQRSGFAMAAAAFFAILRRDLLVTWRELIAFLIQVLIQPLFLLFIFGKVLPGIGFASPSFGAIFLPGVVGFTVVLTALQGVTLPLVLDLGYAREIDDRLLAPLPVDLVAVEKIIFAALRGLVAGVVIFPLAHWILGSGYQVRTDDIGTLIGLLVLTAFAGASLGLTIGTLIKPEQIGLMFSLIITPLIFLGCTYYPWGTLGSLKWFQVITLFNPLTYASEGLRYAMVPTLHGYTLPTLGIGWVLLGLSATVVIFSILGIRAFHRRVVN
jgi:ABC-2 type transport system permease protein